MAHQGRVHRAVEPCRRDWRSAGTTPQRGGSYSEGKRLPIPRPLTRALIEAAAVETVCAHLETDGWTVEDVQAKNVGWDLTAVKLDATRRIEVKGRGTAALDILLTANEWRAAKDQPGWELAVVTTAATAPELPWLDAAYVVDSATPLQYRLRS